MLSRFRLIIDIPRSATQNMALDEALVETQTADAMPCIRFYQWEEPAVTVGYFESVEKTVSRLQAGKKDLAVVRRLTGGGAVLHGKDLTFSLCARLPNPRIPSDVKDSYLKINEAIRMGLKENFSKIDYADCKTISSQSSRQKDRVCFESPSCYDLLLDGKKILGASQRRFGSAILHQSTLFIQKPFGELISMIRGGFETLWKVEFFEKAITTEEIKRAQKIERERYNSKEWAYLPDSFLREAIFLS